MRDGAGGQVEAAGRRALKFECTISNFSESEQGYRLEWITVPKDNYAVRLVAGYVAKLGRKNSTPSEQGRTATEILNSLTLDNVPSPLTQATPSTIPPAAFRAMEPLLGISLEVPADWKVHYSGRLDKEKEADAYAVHAILGNENNDDTLVIFSSAPNPAITEFLLTADATRRAELAGSIAEQSALLVKSGGSQLALAPATSSQAAGYAAVSVRCAYTDKNTGAAMAFVMHTLPLKDQMLSVMVNADAKHVDLVAQRALTSLTVSPEAGRGGIPFSAIGSGEQRSGNKMYNIGRWIGSFLLIAVAGYLVWKVARKARA